MDLCCYPDVGTLRNYEIEAIELPIVYNRFGDHDPNGLLYVPKKDAARIREEAERCFSQAIPQPWQEVRPLVLRANLGDTVKVTFSHSLDRDLSIHVQGLDYDVQTSDGASVGFNADSTTRHRITYTWYARQEGVFLFHDMGDTRSSEEGTNVHGLFGAIIVEPAGSRWLDPETGKPLESGLFADIYPPAAPAFREYAVFFHDELEIDNKDGEQPVDPHTGLPSSTTAISYRAEPMRNRLPLSEDHADTGEDISMSSWVYGDPAPPLLRAYVGDPARIRLVHGGIKETHVFHLHNHQWRLDGDDPLSTSIDSISLSPQECYTLDILHGAGSRNGMIGDAIFHCHLYPHFHEGMWTLWRVHDRLEDGSGRLPDGTRIPPLLPLADRPAPPEKDPLHPGYPNFMAGAQAGAMPDNASGSPDPPQAGPDLPQAVIGTEPERCTDCTLPEPLGQRPLQPPLGILNPDGTNKIDPTPLERANFVRDFEPGALYTDTCPCRELSCGQPPSRDRCGDCPAARPDSDAPLRVFELALIQAKVTYNRFGWHDPQGRFFVTREALEHYGGLEAYIRKVECGQIQPEPLVLRANAGDCIEVRLTNLLPEFLEASAFQRMTLTDIAGFHIHLVKFDTIVSDGAANGWNNIAGARQYETLIERFFADVELNTVFFHDHLYANSHQQHGVFGALLVEEAGAIFHHIRTGKEINYGTRAVIRRPDGTSFREFALFVHDFALLFDRNGEPLNPPEVPGSHDDPGVMGINYRCEPLRERLQKHHRPDNHPKASDPAYVFSSLVHGDPATPILETYPGDELMIRLLDGAHEEQHSFNLTGLSWQKELEQPRSPVVASQTLGISEAFNVHVTETYGPGDHLYYYGGIDDVWLGLWGILRSYDRPQKHLKPLCRMPRLLPLPPCPGKNSIIRRYEVAAIQREIPYNRHGDHDPDGLLFVPLAEAEAARRRDYRPKPLILRANAGDWIEVTLHNLFDPERPVPYFDYPEVPLDLDHRPSMRVSLNPQSLHYDPVCDSGINVGRNNREQTVGPGESKKYLWLADREYGARTLQSFGDLRNHRYHGLFGAILIEPPESCWYCTDSLKHALHEEEAVITAPGRDPFRECVVLIQNGIRMLDVEGNLVKTMVTAAEPDGTESPDPEDTGEKGYNYRSERFSNRLERDDRISQVFSSRIHGDPATPLFRAYTGDRVVFRTLMPADKPRNVGFAIHGHTWRRQPDNPVSDTTALQGAISIGNTFRMDLDRTAAVPGDYLYRSGSLKWDVESGMWGIFRLCKKGLGCKCKNACRNLCRQALEKMKKSS